MTPQEKRVREAVAAGIRTCVPAGALAAGAVTAGHFASPAFRGRLGMLPKALIVGGAFFGGFVVRAESVLSEHAAQPRLVLERRQRGAWEKMSLRAATVFMDQPLKVVGALAVPAVLGVGYRMFQDRGVQFQQRVMHTRVVGQFTVLCLLLTTMGASEWLQHAKHRVASKPEELEAVGVATRPMHSRAEMESH